MEKSQYLIVGGSAAGMAAAQAIRNIDAKSAITILSEEADPPYFRPMIPFLISRRKRAEEVALEGQGPYQACNIEVRLNTRAQGVDPAMRQVASTRGDRYSYDRLLIATGSRPHIPPEIAGTHHKGVFALRTLEDARRAAERAGGTRQAVMLGGGLLNLKAAFALLERGIEVTLVVYSPEVLSQLMEPQDALLIRKALDEAGLKIITGTSATEISAADQGVTGVALDNGDELTCQMVCIGKGVRPNTDWLDPEAMEINGGLVVDKQTRTSADGIYAAGDVAVTFDPITDEPMMTGLWTNAVEMGRCAGANMAGQKTAYGGTFGILNATQVADMPFVSMGMVHTAGTDYQVHVRQKAVAYRKLVFSADGHRLVGAVFVGDIAKAGLYRVLIQEKKEIKGISQQIIDHALHYGHLLCSKR